MKRAKTFLIPGVYGDLHVKLVSRRTIKRHAGSGSSRDEVINGLYLDGDHLILIATELHGPARISTLLHELHHSVMASTEDLDEERACDVIGSYYYRLYNDPIWLGLLEELGHAASK